MKKVNIKSMVVGKDITKGLQTPKFRLHSGDENPNNIMVAHYEFINEDVEVTNVYRVVDILNECIDDYHKNHKDD